jgi:cytidine deaminase
MKKETYNFEYELYDSASELGASDRELLEEARRVTAGAYAPYSRFKVGAVAILKNGKTVTGTNQENASYPVGICAERVLLANAATLFPNEAIDTLAISYNNTRGESNKPVSPCGMCRQSLCEYEDRVGSPIRIILSGLEGKVIVIKQSSQLLPFSFRSSNLNSST